MRLPSWPASPACQRSLEVGQEPAVVSAVGMSTESLKGRILSCYKFQVPAGSVKEKLTIKQLIFSIALSFGIFPKMFSSLQAHLKLNIIH